MLISDVLLFLRIAETSSFKEAAKHLSISRAQASKRILALEDELGTPLMYRTPRNMSLTAAGETLLQHYRRIFDLMEEARIAVEQLRNAPAGRLRLSLPTYLGSVLLPKIYSEFLQQHPDIALDAHTSDTFVDVVAGGYDLVIRVAQRLSDSTLTARRLATSPVVLAAAPAYLIEHGTPSHPAELTRHWCLGLQTAKASGGIWRFRMGSQRLSVPLCFRAVSDNNLALVRAACAGLGFIYAPRSVISRELRDGLLDVVLPEFCLGLDFGIYAVHAGRIPTRNAAALIEFVADMLPGCEGVDCQRRFSIRTAPSGAGDLSMVRGCGAPVNEPAAVSTAVESSHRIRARDC